MNIDQFKSFTNEAFGELLNQFKEQEEYGFNNMSDKEIVRIGYSTNLTPDIITEAHRKSLDMIITHHDAWDFLYSLRTECLDLLQQYNMIHYFVHLR